MPILTNTIRSQATLTGAAADISLGMKVIQATDIAVWRLRDDSPTLLTYGTDYTISGLNSDSGATVSISGQAADDEITVVWDMDYTVGHAFKYGTDRSGERGVGEAWGGSRERGDGTN